MFEVYKRSGLTAGALLALVGALALPAEGAPTPLRAVRVVMDDNYPPYAFRDDQGILQGIAVDQWRLWEKKTGVTVNLQGMAWAQALRRMEAGEFDVIDTIFRTRVRQALFDYSRPYATLEVPIFFHRDLSGISGITSLRGFTVAVKSGDAALDLLKKNGVTNFVTYLSYERIVEAARQHEVSVFVMDKPPALYFLYKSRLQNQFKMSAPLYTGRFHRAVHKGRGELLTAVEQGFAAISAQEYQDIDQRWMGEPAFPTRYLWAVVGVLAGVLVVLLGLWVWNRALRRAVREKTAQLEQEVAVSHQREQALGESETKFRLFIEHSPGLIFVKDQRLRTVMLSRSFESLLGRPMAELTGRTNEELFPELAEQMTRDDQAVLQLPYGEFHLIEESHNGRTYLTHKFPVPHQGGKGIGGFTIDITDRKAMEEERRRFEAQLQHTQKLESLGVLAGGVAHDFNNILTAILGNVDLALADVAPGSAARESLNDAASASRRAAELCRQMLAYAGKGRFVVERLDLNQVLRDMVHIIEVSLSKTVTLRWNLADHLPALHADSTQLRQIIMNLVINAAESIGDQPGVVILSSGVMNCGRAELADSWVGASLAEGTYVFFEVADSGCGMTPDTLSRIFDPFFSTKFTGRGLGLAAVLGIVRSHHGAIKVRSQPGQGSTFRVVLPAAAEAPAGLSPERAGALSWRGTGTVLLVDDEESVRSIAQRMLARLGYQVLTATDGAQALQVFQAHRDRIALVLLDLTMPNLDGERTLEELLRLQPRLKVILSSGYDENEVTRRLEGQGMAGFVQKPYTLENLAEVLKKATA